MKRKIERALCVLFAWVCVCCQTRAAVLVRSAEWEKADSSGLSLQFD